MVQAAVQSLGGMEDDQLSKAAEALVAALAGATDAEIETFAARGHLLRICDSILDMSGAEGTPPYEFLLKNKVRSSVVAYLHQLLVRGYATPGNVDGHPVFVSPMYPQFRPDGVVFLQGEKPFAGVIGLFTGSAVKFAIAARDMVLRRQDPAAEDFEFVDVEEVRRSIEARRTPADLNALDQAVADFEGALGRRENDEAVYQELFARNPWMFGGHYVMVQSHEALDDANIPDFTGCRAADSDRDILEIKKPFLDCFNADGTFSAEFNRAWDQTERYLDFARREADYLRRQKGLIFNNPHAYLIVGHDPTSGERDLFSRKCRMNPAITLYTYDEMLTLARNVVEFYKGLRGIAE
jgi:hypothetical protein